MMIESDSKRLDFSKLKKPFKRKFKKIVRHKVQRENETIVRSFDYFNFEEYKGQDYSPNEHLINQLESISKNLDLLLEREINNISRWGEQVSNNREQLLLLASEVSNKIKSRLESLKKLEITL